MAAEALARLEQPEAVGPWVHRYRLKLEDAPVARARLRDEEWREALGRFERVADWAALLEEELREAPWRAVLERWSARLAGGLAAAAFHGVIRTGHAVRALEKRKSRPRLEELAQGLAYWAARYQALPERRAAIATGRLPSQALLDVPFLPKEQRRGGFITDGLLALEGFPPFAEVADRADTTVDPSLFLSDLTRAFAAVLRDEAHDSGRVIAFVHAVTGPSAVRLLLPHVSTETARALLRYVWQAAAAVYSAFGRSPEPASLPSVPGIPDLVGRAVANGDEHAIKLTEACLREHASRPDPVYLEAIAQTLERIGSS